MEFVEHYSHVMHLVSTLRSRLRADVDCLDALAACFPAGHRFRRAQGARYGDH